MSRNRPLTLVDLDDTLFQTARKMPEGVSRHVATLDVKGQPNGYMSDVQKAFVEWLLKTTDVVPVTARSIEAFSRVRLSFACGAVCSQGGVILGSDGQQDQDWHELMSETLAEFQNRLPELIATTLAIGEEMGFSLRGWLVEEAGLLHYLVVKHNDSDDAVLLRTLTEVRARGLLKGMYIHRNGNNLAFLPNGLAKRLAVQEFLRRDRVVHGERPVLGFGDSITDLGFMDLCHMWSTPARGQLARWVKAAADA
uniref:Uncharacterized protein n=1 Tax=symbiont bacterium of Paederus fuscipes TaxID=176282 RepID=Q6VTC6_UNCXX|nr:hypothetical protein [symbiont bacterium of Paederus fuscipes]